MRLTVPAQKLNKGGGTSWPTQTRGGRERVGDSRDEKIKGDPRKAIIYLIIFEQGPLQRLTHYSVL